MEFVLVPSEKPLATMEDVDQAMIRAQTLLQKGTPTDSNQHEERFRFFTQAAMKAPFLTLDKSETDSQTWKDKKMCVKDVLNEVLPLAIMASVAPKLEAIQGIIDGSAKIKDFTSFWYSKESGNKHVVQFCIKRIPQWGKSQFEVYFVDIKASFSSSAVFGIASTCNFMEARYCFQQYSTNTAFLLQEMRTNVKEVRDEMEGWNRMTKSIC